MAETLAIIDYGSGNLRSVSKALERAALDHGLNTRILVTDDAQIISQADRIVLPGVGAFGHCAAALRAKRGIWQALNTRVIEQAAPFLGICVGMQLMATHGVEHGVHGGLDWISGEVVKLKPNDTALKIPHMGWNKVAFARDHALLQDLPDQSFAYFVHSFCFSGVSALATTTYGGEIAAMIGSNNMIGTQFHPEKSQGFGLAFLAAFLKWKP
jgi:imidazole glycerol-phosphate synthase subunit HisH